MFVAGDLVNVPGRASEWFDDTRGSAFFPVLQGNSGCNGTVQSNDHAMFSVFDTGPGQVVSYSFDLRTPDVAPVVLDRFNLGRPRR
ncbi:hypothetical protein CC117_26940 [Parafrankia colletiae]|uniref:Uncharacterized protein n=1 Tax=Parafrankia colletiae TaxID=573497 RepID=A0A1S1QC41_9ACTN|nr:hypothetical protein [Parafrankia colletiae]MCK9903468.1 hypothetical protein [Frankia sp. Cpl3]OHV31166.1 hypothetical protein CC117_26940 [Parafrankia colletiae]